MGFHASVGSRSHLFADLRELMAKATPLRSGDQLAGIAADSTQERVAACEALADVPLATFLSQALVPYERDAVTEAESIFQRRIDLVPRKEYHLEQFDLQGK